MMAVNYWALWLRIGDPHQGAEIINRLAVGPQYQGVTGGYFDVGTGQPITPVFPANDAVAQKELWNATGGAAAAERLHLVTTKA
ncbi:hypothetical protein [Paenibacillus rigui]|uniref:Uncharacterized protein n=1 Tax=Paenibacillus rigui TaxID=554312 RepID=A0A229UIL2_9BACL|nr:hypothetical protein [Paenibacillus rigui]OXM83201.1 hypothetical protein CF651_27095 [Paenibacillus rigui]